MVVVVVGRGGAAREVGRWEEGNFGLSHPVCMYVSVFVYVYIKR